MTISLKLAIAVFHSIIFDIDESKYSERHLKIINEILSQYPRIGDPYTANINIIHQLVCVQTKKSELDLRLEKVNQLLEELPTKEEIIQEETVEEADKGYYESIF